jgi:hypothetical protein
MLPRMSPAFAAASAVTPRGALEFAAEVPDGWQQGPGAFGGLVIGTLLRAMEAAEPDAKRRARTFNADLCGPVVVGPADLAVRVLRRGGRQTNLAVELRQNGEVVALGSAILSEGRSSPAAPPLDPPPPPGDWRSATVLPVGPPIAPVFTPHYEYRSDEPAFAVGPLRSLGWIREREPLVAVDAPALLGRLDAWWPALFALEGRPRPVTTISFAAQILCDPSTLVADEPLRYRARVASLDEGFFLEMRELWLGDRPVALNQQTFAILK